MVVRAIIIPVGVTKESVEGILKDLMPVDIIISVTVPGYEETKAPILNGLRELAKLVGAVYFHIVAAPKDVGCFAEILTILKHHRPDEVFLVGVTGSRYLLPPLITALLKYWRDTGTPTYLLYGVEGEDYSIEPLPGFFSTTMRLSKIQRALLEIIYGSKEPISGKELKEKYGFTHSVYAVLRDMERKGLLIIRRNKIEKTFPGKLVYSLLRSCAEEDNREG